LRFWLLPRILELTYTAWDLEPFARDCGYDGPPYRWDAGRRFLLRCELDAAFFHLYGISREDVVYVMETFPVVKRKDEQQHGEYRTKRVILEIYDALAEAARTGQPYRTRLDPPPADPRVTHQPQKAQRAVAVVDPLFPGTERDRLLCAAMLDLVQAESELPATAYLEALLLLTSPERCRTLLDAEDQRAFGAALAAAPQELVGAPDKGVCWRLVQDALRANRALTPAPHREPTGLTTGPRFASVRTDYPALPEGLISLVAKAARALRVNRSEAGPEPAPTQQARQELAALAAAEMET
jgi:hypothetical protein